MSKPRSMARVGALAALLMASYTVSAVPVRVTITNNAPDLGVFLTPAWVGFHNGSFDSYDGGAPSAPELERLAEDGNNAPISGVFGSNGTLVSTGIMQTGTRVQGNVGAAPIGPSATVSQVFDLSGDGSNSFFSYASMVLPTSDYFVANGDAMAHDVSNVILLGDILTFNIGTPGTVNDAGTEINDFSTSAGNGLRPDLALPAGQMGPDQGADEGGVITPVMDPFANFLNGPGFPALSQLDFNNANLYPTGIATITIERLVPEPGVLVLTMLGLLFAGPGVAFRRRNRG